MPGANAKNFVEVEDIRDSVVIVKGGALRSVIEVTALNFDLKSADEQQGIIQGFQGFLNTIDFPLQLLTQSRTLDIAGYLKQVERMVEGQTNELLKIQTTEYIRFIQGLSELANIMSKKFYIVVPYYSGVVVKTNALDRLRKVFSRSKKGPATTSDGEFEKSRAQLEERVNVVSNAITGSGVTARVLDAQELMSLYYGYYNFGQTIHS